ncbi:MAG TPA: AI-2E family transporter [Candidatus Limnocylindrales bacterium]|nr:AI-2E family transporter [Candidatus Limnocylindrales bacterium]
MATHPPDDALRVAELEAQALQSDPEILRTLGPPLSRRSPFMIGLLGAAGVVTTLAIARIVLDTSSVLLVIGLSLFLAIGMEPAVQRLMLWRLPRWVAVAIVSGLMLLIVFGFLAMVIPVLVGQLQRFLESIPSYLDDLHRNPTFAGLDARYHISQQIDSASRSIANGTVFGGVLGAGKVVLSATASTLTVLVLTTYLLADMPRIRQLIYQLIPASRRPAAILLGDEMLAKVGGYVLGNLITSLIAGIGTFFWLLAFDVPYAALLGITVAFLDLIPVIGAPLGGAICTLVALTVSAPIAIATAIFYTVYKLLEDWFLVPRIIGRTVDVPATVTLVAALVGGAALGIMGAVIAIPIAAALRLWLREILLPRLDQA